MTDESGEDNKLIVVPENNIDSNNSTINSIDDISINKKQEIEYFFLHYKDLEDNKWSIINGIKNYEYAINLLNNSNI